MANIASARKRIRQTERRTARNTARMSRMRTFIKKVEVAIASGNKDEAAAALKLAQPEIQRACNQGRCSSQHRCTQDFPPVSPHQGYCRGLIRLSGL
jgi:small subunit ribosomal protein S20